jgi:multiple sugar transport system permease protein
MTTILQLSKKTGLKIFLTRRRRKMISGYLYISPWLLGFTVFILGPILASLMLSFSRYNLLSDPKFIGFENYTYIFLKDALFVGAVQRTLFFAITVVVVGLSLSLSFALLLNQGLKGTTFFRTSFFIPSLTPIVAAAIIWKWILSPAYGPVNGLLNIFGLQGPGWYLDADWALVAIVLVWLWLNTGGSNMIIFLAGLQNVPQELYDASHVDGANAWQRFVHVTLPMLSPTLFFNMVVGIIGGLRVFSLPYVMSATIDTVGGPAYATWFYMIHLYNEAFKGLQMGMASALAWLFFLVVLVLTILQFVGSRHWVYYESGE